MNKLSCEDVAALLKHSSLGGTTQGFVLFSSPCTPLKMLMWKTQSNKFADRGCSCWRVCGPLCVLLYLARELAAQSTAKGPYPFTFTALTQYVCGCICVILPSRGIARNNLRKDCRLRTTLSLPPPRLPRLIFNHLGISTAAKCTLSFSPCYLENWNLTREKIAMCVPGRRADAVSSVGFPIWSARCRVSARLFSHHPPWSAVSSQSRNWEIWCVPKNDGFMWALAT